MVFLDNNPTLGKNKIIFCCNVALQNADKAKINYFLTSYNTNLSFINVLHSVDISYTSFLPSNMIKTMKRKTQHPL